MKTRVHVMISGRVQGVFFRLSTRKKAESLGITGWVRNTRNGRVEAVFEGDRNKIDKMLDFCHEGPSAARVTDVEVEWKEFEGEFSDFKVRY